MTMTIDDQHRRRFGPSLNFHHMSTYPSQPHFTDPWSSSSSPTGPGPQGPSQPHSLYTTASSQDSAGLPHLNLAALPRQSPSSQHPHHSQHTQHSGSATAGSTSSMAPYTSLPVTAAAASGVYRQHELLSIPPDPFSLNRLQPPATSAAYDTSAAYTSTSSPVNATYPTTSASPYDQLGYAPAQMRGAAFALGHEDGARRYSQQSVASSLSDLSSTSVAGSGAGGPPPGFAYSDYEYRSLQPDDRRSFQDALEASHGMLSMSQETPRNIYDVRNRARGSADSYGFPSTHSSTSSVSSNGFSNYYGGSVDGSISDYSATGSDIESLSGRTLPRPQGLMTAQPPAPQSMMGSFSSRVSSSAQKKHKCKVCDKRFTRPSSLQTHMYSHTGEKPFGCEVDGCGRRFSVVSNLRRHKKVHKRGGDTPSDTGSEDHQSP